MDPASASSDYNSHRGSIPKLSTGGNWLSWNWSIEPFFKTKKCWNIVQGTETRPQQLAVNATEANKKARAAEIEDYDLREAAGLIILTGAIRDDVQLFRAIASSRSHNLKHCYDQLKAIFNSTSSISVTTLNGQFNDLSNRSGLDARTYINEVISLAARMEDCGKQVSDKEIMIKIANTICPDDTTMKTMLLYQANNATELNAFNATIIETVDYMRMNQTVAEQRMKKETLMYSNSDKGKYRQNPAYRRHQNHRVGGKFKRDNYEERFGKDAALKAGKRNTDLKRTPSGLTCFQCGGKGHIKAVCPSAAPNSKRG